jgi:rod shape-determining protein MreC
MRDLFRFLFRIRNLVLFLALLAVSMSLLVTYNMHQRAQAISSSNVVVGELYSWRSGITEFASLRDVNKDLVDALARERERHYAVKLTHDSSQVFEDTVRQLRYRFITAQVINSTAHKQKNFITLDKGSLDGVRPNMGVIGAQGIVGMVLDTSPHFALVVSVLNPKPDHSVMLKGTKHFGLLRWDTSDPMRSSLVDIDKHVPVHKGDTVVTRGNDKVFPPGIPVGIVESVTNDPSIGSWTIRVLLSEDLTRSGYVHVVSDLMEQELQKFDSTIVAP